MHLETLEYGACFNVVGAILSRPSLFDFVCDGLTFDSMFQSEVHQYSSMSEHSSSEDNDIIDKEDQNDQ